jgi:hypothetical protein
MRANQTAQLMVRTNICRARTIEHFEHAEPGWPCIIGLNSAGDVPSISPASGIDHRNRAELRQTGKRRGNPLAARLFGHNLRSGDLGPDGTGRIDPYAHGRLLRCGLRHADEDQHQSGDGSFHDTHFLPVCFQFGEKTALSWS